MSAALGDVALVERLVEVLADEELPEAIRERLAVAFAMLGAPQMRSLIVEMLPTSEPAYVALRAILQGEAATADAVRDGVRNGREAVRTLRDEPSVRWNLDFEELARQIRFESSSRTERQVREAWLTDLIRDSTYARLLALLLPSERLALHRVGGFVDSDTTRDWLATWIPAYREVATTEVARLQERIDAGTLRLPLLDLDSLSSLSEFEALAQTAGLLSEWWKCVEERHSSACVQLMRDNRDLLASPFARDVNNLATKLNPGWPVASARSFLLHTVSMDDDLAFAQRLLTVRTATNDTAKKALGDNASAALGAASLGVVLTPTDASSYFYAALALLLAEQFEAAQRLMQGSAARASAQQATQGRKSLREFGERHGVLPEVIEDLREILRGAMRSDDPDQDAATDGADLNPTDMTLNDDHSPEAD
jgi:hypothetical protein